MDPTLSLYAEPIRAQCGVAREGADDQAIMTALITRSRELSSSISNSNFLPKLCHEGAMPFVTAALGLSLSELCIDIIIA